MQPEIQSLPRHTAKFFAYLICSIFLFFVGGFLAVVGGNSDAAFLSSTGIGIAILSVVAIILCIKFADQAKCPSCKNKMEQTWDSEAESTTGLFKCSQCGKKWKTGAKWGFEK